MKAKDLMIGSIVTFKDSLEGAAIPLSVKVVGIGYQDKGGEDECLVCIGGDESGCDIIEIDDEVVGIPITSDFLEKNGFKVYQHGNGFMFILADDYYDITAREFNDGLWKVEYDCTEMGGIPTQSVNISFIHELQHFFRLCGVNMEITL